jgi:hypothetical protein
MADAQLAAHGAGELRALVEAAAAQAARRKRRGHQHFGTWEPGAAQGQPAREPCAQGEVATMLEADHHAIDGEAVFEGSAGAIESRMACRELPARPRQALLAARADEVTFRAAAAQRAVLPEACAEQAAGRPLLGQLFGKSRQGN